MSQCRDIQPELSAYVDNELPPSQRAEIAEHVASCSRCQKELAELQTLAAGMAALPKLQPAPRFLGEVRRKIVRGDRPEPMTWHDYLFRPFWLKLPIEVVAVIAIVALVSRYEEPPPPNKPSVGAYQIASAQNAEGDRDDNTGRNKTANALESDKQAETLQAPVGQLASTAPENRNEIANAPQAEPSPPQDSISSSAEEKRTIDGLAVGGSVPVTAGGNGGFETRRRAVISSGTAGMLARSTPNAVVLAQDAGIDPSKLDGVMIVDGKSATEMRSQAEQLAARCNGTVITAPQSKDFTGQVFFVEIPQEYAATFKLEMSRISNSSNATDVVLARYKSGVITGVTLAVAAPTGAITGVLTGTRNTNVTVDSSRPITMDDILGPKKPATVVLEIVVVPPKTPTP